VGPDPFYLPPRPRGGLGYTRSVTSRRPIQFSLSSLFCLIVGLGSVLGSLLPHGAFAPVVGWCILAAFYYFQGWRDLVFVHGVLPGISLTMLAMLSAFAVLNLTGGPWGPFRDDFLAMAYWLLFVGCLAGNIVSQFYYVYLLAVVRPESTED